FFVDRATYDEAMAAAALFVRGLHEALRHPAAGVARELEARPRRRALLADALAKGAHLGGRVDMLLTASGPKVLEYNAVTPDRLAGGVEFSDPLCAKFAESPAMRDFSRAHPNHFVTLYDRLFDSFVSKHARRGGAGAPSVAEVFVPARADGAARAEPEALDDQMVELFGYLYGRGIGIQMCGLADLRYENGALSANGSTIDVVFLAGDPEYLDVCPDDDPLWRAVRDGAVATACGYPLGNLLFEKSLLADLTDPAVTRDFDPALAEGLARVVPWTRRLGDAKTTFRGAPIDLVAFARERREELVLKPSAELGGNGVVLGWEVTPEAWAERLAAAPAGYVVQERVRGRTVEMPYVEGGAVARAEFFFDFNPYIWSDGSAAGAITRISRSGVLNVGQGTGSIAPVFVLDPAP
ncbi:MAG TPA: hypothetical protein VFS00_09855, partial [Polyangiaceae bacterium]|nr:hypothetical protein [Polyangiaceae bacterium]